MKRLGQILIIFIIIGYCSLSIAAEDGWRRLYKGSILLYCHEKDLRHGDKIISIIGRAMPVISGEFGLSQRPKITVLVAPSQKIFDQITGKQIPEWGIAAADPSQSILFLKSPRIGRPETDLESAVLHELSHVLLSVAAGGRPIERWFDEGLAMTASGEKGFLETLALARAVLAGEILRLDEIDEVLTFRRQKADLAYQESLSAVQFLIRRFGRESLIGIIRQIGQNNTMDAALRSVVGIGLGEFEEDWFHAMRVKYRWAIFLNFPFLISVSMVVLFLAAFFVTRLRIKKRKKVWKQEDRYEFETIEDH